MEINRSINKIKPLHLFVTGLFLLSIVVSTLIMTSRANAFLDSLLVRFDNIEVSTATTGTVCANPETVGTEATVRVTFPTGYTVNATPANHTVSTTNLAWPSGAIAWPGISTASGVSGQIVTFPSTDLTPGTLYCFNWTGGSSITTQGSASSTNTGSVSTYTSAPAVIDTTAFVTQTLTDDDIVVTATVPQTFSFALSANTDALGTLSTGSVTTSPTPRTVTISTNAQFGWMVWAREDSNAGLYSATSTTSLDSTAGTATNLAAGTAGYITGVTDTDGGAPGTITVVSAFDYDIATDGAGLDNTLRLIASSNGTANADILTLRNQAAISNVTPAATDYTDTITIVGAGLF
jgi:hypothetical protein